MCVHRNIYIYIYIYIYIEIKNITIDSNNEGIFFFFFHVKFFFGSVLRKNKKVIIDIEICSFIKGNIFLCLNF